MDEQAVRKTYRYNLKPTPQQEQELERVLWLCRTLYNTALEQRITAYRRCGVTITCSQQQAQLPDLKAAFAEYAAIHSQILQDVLTRLDKTFQAFFHRVKTGQTPGFPRYQGRDRYNSFTYPQFDNGQRRAAGGNTRKWLSRLVEDWPHRGAVEPSTGRDTQDRHDQP